MWMSWQTLTIQGTRLQSSKTQSKNLFRDMPMGAFRCDNRNTLWNCAEGSLD